MIPPCALSLSIAWLGMTAQASLRACTGFTLKIGLPKQHGTKCFVQVSMPNGGCSAFKPTFGTTRGHRNGPSCRFHNYRLPGFRQGAESDESEVKLVLSGVTSILSFHSGKL